jgi:hypothetical protein
MRRFGSLCFAEAKLEAVIGCTKAMMLDLESQ